MLVERARLHARQNACTVWNTDKDTWDFLPVWGTSAYKMGQYGVGVQLYFEFLSHMCIVFVFMAVVTSPGLALNIRGDCVIDAAKGTQTGWLYSLVASLSVANLGHCQGVEGTSEQQLRERLAWHPDSTSDPPKLSDWTPWLGLLDGIAVLVFVFFSIWFRFRWIPFRTYKNDVKHITAADYAAQIHGLPKRLDDSHHRQYKKRLWRHVREVLRRAGVVDPDAVQEVTMVRDYDGAVQQFQTKGMLLHQQRSLEVKMEQVRNKSTWAKLARRQRQLADKVYQLERSLKGQASLTSDDRGVCGAFVLFNESVHKDAFLDEYRLSNSRLFRYLQESHKCFEGCRIAVSQAPEPNEIFWQNMDLPMWWQMARQLLTLVLTVLLLSCTSMILVWVRSTSTQVSMECSEEVSFEVAKSAVDAAESVAQDPVVACYCKQQLRARGVDFRLPPYSSPEEQLCASWSEVENTELGRLVLVIAAVVVFNKVLVAAFSYFAIWERHRKVTDLTRSQLWKLLLAQFINTGVLVLLVNADLRGSTDGVPEILFILNGSFDDFEDAWFVSVGSVLALTISAQVISTTVPPLFMSFVVRPLRARWCYSQAVTQETLNRVYQLPEWNLALRFAQTLNVIFVVMMYSGGMPVLNMVGAIYCFVAYWSDKCCLLWGSCRPRPYKEEVACMSVNLLPLAAFFHIAISLWTFGQQDLFPSGWSFLMEAHSVIIGMSMSEYEDVMGVYRRGSAQQRDERFLDYLRARVLDMAREGCWFLLVVLGFLCAFFTLRCLWTCVLRPLGKPMELVTKECLRRYAGVDSGLILGRVDPGKTLLQARCEGDLQKAGRGESYELQANWRYRDVCRALGLLGEDDLESWTSSPRQSARSPRPGSFMQAISQNKTAYPRLLGIGSEAVGLSEKKDHLEGVGAVEAVQETPCPSPPEAELAFPGTQQPSSSPCTLGKRAGIPSVPPADHALVKKGGLAPKSSIGRSRQRVAAAAVAESAGAPGQQPPEVANLQQSHDGHRSSSNGSPAEEVFPVGPQFSLRSQPRVPVPLLDFSKLRGTGVWL